VERAGPRDVVQYRGEILPLVHLSRVLRRPRREGGRKAARPPADAPTVPVVVVAGGGRRVGLVVARILDVAEETLAARSDARRPGVLFTAVIRDRVTEFLDVEAVLRSVDPDVPEASPTAAVEA
jgi:two-component system chemotaxis sensor kinase CheA